MAHWCLHHTSHLTAKAAGQTHQQAGAVQTSDKELQLKDLSEDLKAAQQQTADLQSSLQQEQQHAADLRSQGASSEQQLQEARLEVDRQAAELQTLQGTCLTCLRQQLLVHRYQTCSG